MQRRTAIGGTVAGIIAATLPSATRAADAVVRIATLPIDAGAQAYYADDMQFFQAAGISAQIRSIPNGAAIASAVLSKAVDVGFSNLITLAAAHQHDVPFTVLAPGSLYVSTLPTSVLMVPQNSPLRSAADLKGKTIGVSGLKNITQYAPELWLDRNGGDSSTVHFIEMTFPQIVESLDAGRLDAGIVAEPFVTAAKHGARVMAPVYDAVAPRFIIGCWFSTVAWAREHPELVMKFRAVMTKTADWANGHTRQSGRILAKYGKFDPATLTTMLRVSYAPRFDLTEMQPVIDLAARYGGLSASFPVDELVFKP